MPTVFSDASSFPAAPSKYPSTAGVGTNMADNTASHQPTNMTLPDTADQYLAPNRVVVNSFHDSTLTDQIVPQLNTLPAHGSGPVSADHVVPNVNISSLGYSEMPIGLPAAYTVHQPASETYPVQHPTGENYIIPASYSIQEPPRLPQGNVLTSPSHPQLNVAGVMPHPQQEIALPPGSHIPSQNLTTPETYPQNTGFSPQHNITVPSMHPQQNTGPHLSDQNVVAALGPHSQQNISPLGPHLQHNMGLHPQQDVNAAQGNVMEPIAQPQHYLHPAVTPPQQQNAAIAHNMPPQNPSPSGGWSHNPRVAYGPIPAPPTYEDAHTILSHPPVQPPLPPPISVPPSSSINDPHNAAPASLHTDPGVRPDHQNWGGTHHEPAPYLDNAKSLQSTEPVQPVPVVQVIQRPTDAPTPIVQPADVQMVASQHHHHHHHPQNQANHIVHRQPDLTLALNQLQAEREAALERERQQKVWMEKEKEELLKKREELEAMISRSNASEQQVVEWKQQLVAKENELSAKQMEQQTALQEQRKQQEQKEKEISDIVQKLNAEKEALERQKEQQQTELIRQQESIEQQRIAALNELQREKDAILKQQKELSERQQNMEEQVSKWIQMRGENSSRQLRVETGLPTGWEKKFDSTTGRFYYQDHNTKTTHWNPPSNWLMYNNNNTTQLKPGVTNNSLQPPQQPVSTSNNLPQPSSRPTEGNSIPAPTSRPTTAPLQLPPSSVTAKKPVLPPQVPAAGHIPSTGPVAKTVSDINKPAVVPDRSTKPQRRVSSDPVKQISPSMWKQKMENLQPVHGGSLVCYICVTLTFHKKYKGCIMYVGICNILQ